MKSRPAIWKSVATFIVLAVVASACAGSQSESTVAAPSSASTSAAPVAPAPAATVAEEPTTTVPALKPHRIGVVDGKFVDNDTGDAFVPRGVNYLHLGSKGDLIVDPSYYNKNRVDTDFATMHDHGLNTVRIFFDMCQCNTTNSGLSPRWLDVMTEILELAAQHELVIVFTSNDLPDGGPYTAEADADTDGATFPGYRNTNFLTASGHQAFVHYWSDIIGSLADRAARLDVVLGWSILNEEWVFGDQPPMSLDSGVVHTAAGEFDLSQPDVKREMVVANIRALTHDVADTIHEIDSTALVTMGFFIPQFPVVNDVGGSWYVDTAPLVEESGLDFFDFHAYPGGFLDPADHATNFGITDAKPAVMGEVGAFKTSYDSPREAAVAVQKWIADSCDVGYDGWLYWSWETLDASDATWGMASDDEYLLNHISPAAQPDQCVQTIFDLNLARKGEVRASGSTPDDPPQNAIDGSLDSVWLSGGDPAQWIEITLAEPSEVARIELTVAQDPPGPTVHRVTAGFDDGSSRELGVLSESTSDSQTLTLEFPEHLAGVTSIRVTTQSGPSWVAWREVKVLAPE